LAVNSFVRIARAGVLESWTVKKGDEDDGTRLTDGC